MLRLYEKESNDAGAADDDREHPEISAAAEDDLKPSVDHFLTVLLAYSAPRIRGAAEIAQSLLMQMETMYQAGNDDVKPTYRVIYICIALLKNSAKLVIIVVCCIHRRCYWYRVVAMVSS